MKYNIIQDLYEEASAATLISDRRSKRNKLSDRDTRHAKIMMNASELKEEKILLAPLVDTLNMQREESDIISRQTLSRKLEKSDITYSASSASIPREVKRQNLHKWLRRRRGYCAKFIKTNTDRMIMIDESLFGLSRRIHVNEKEWCIRGKNRAHKYVRKEKSKRVSVLGGCGPRYYTDIYIFKSGKYLTQNDYAKIMDSGVYNEMIANSVHTIYQDNCTVHYGEMNECVYMQYNSQIQRKYLIEYSPDTSWMEKVWANMNDILYAGGKKYHSVDELTRAIEETWVTLMTKENYREQLAVHTKEACKKIIDNGGYLTHW